MKRFRMIIAALIATAVIAGLTIIPATAVDVDEQPAAASAGITVHYFSEKAAPTIYYWNALPQNIETNYPGPAMTKDTATGSGWYKYVFTGKTKINVMFVANGVQSEEYELNVSKDDANEWWVKSGKLTTRDPSQGTVWDRTDLREDSIYFVMTTRFYDGDKSNNVHCWDDSKAGNPDTDPAWRGDFKGLIQKLDYIKALGFSAIWITPVVDNASGYDYHGYHAFDFSKVDPRYESKGATYQDLIDACHDKGLKVVQDVVWNHSGNFGENKLCHMFDKKYSSIKDLEKGSCMQVTANGPLAKNYPNYESLNDDQKYQARLACMKTDKIDNTYQYHHDGSMSYESASEQTGQMAGDCVDINTENPVTAKYLNDAYKEYIDMGVDAFRLDTEKHISRWTLNHAFFPEYSKYKNFYIFGEVCARVRDVWNHGIQSDSCPFYTWKETESAWMNNWSKTDWKSNYDNGIKHFNSHAQPTGAPTSQNAFLNGTNYHAPDYSKANGSGTIDFTMHWNFGSANEAYGAALSEDQYFNDSTWNVMYVDSHDYGPDGQEKYRYQGGTQAWAENMNLMFTFRGIPCIFYGSEIEFKNDVEIDVGPNKPLEKTGRAYFGDHIEGTVNASNFGVYTANGTVATTLNKPLAAHLRQLNMIRRAVPALQKGQYKSVGNMAYIRRYTAGGVDSLACVAVSGGATFSGIPNGKYIDAVTGDVKNVSGGSLSVGSVGKGNMRVYVCCASGFKGISGKIGQTGTYLK